jgi:hypothetical protein
MANSLKPERPVRAAVMCTVILTAYLATFWPFVPFGWIYGPIALAFSTLLSFTTIGVIMDGILANRRGFAWRFGFCLTAILVFGIFFELFVTLNNLQPNNVHLVVLMAKICLWIIEAFLIWLVLIAIRGWIKVVRKTA